MRILTVRLKAVYPLLVALSLGAFAFVSLLGVFPVASRRLQEAVAASTTACEPSSIVILDAGHGGEDCGAIGTNGVYEKDLALSMATAVGEELCRLGYTVLYTRTEDRLLYKEEENIRGMRKIYDLKNRCAFAEGYDGALFVSLHMNAFGDARYDGLQVYYSPDREDSRALAEAIQVAVREDVQPENHRKVKSGKDIYILEHINRATVLVECGFISNEAECERLCDATYRSTLARAIARGIAAYRPPSSEQ